VKGVEGGAELPTNRVAIASHRQGGLPERLILRARDHGLWAEETALESLGQWRSEALQALQSTGPLRNGLLWNGGFLLWRAGIADSLEDGLALTERLVRDGALEHLRRHLSGRLAEAQWVRTPAGPPADPAGC
jgi:anthranilate phosphoribosyltransferase